MNRQRTYDLSDCSEFRQTLLAQPPKFVRATGYLLGLLIATALVWAAGTRADIVVRAAGRVRPMVHSAQSPAAAAEESRISPLRGGRVVEVHVHEGQQVKRGDVLIRLGNERLQGDIAKQRRLIQTSNEELAMLDRSAAALGQRFAAAQAKAEAEYAEGSEEIKRATEDRISRIKLAEVALELAKDDRARVRKLAQTRTASASEIVRAEARCTEAQLKLRQASLPVDQGRLEVLRRTLDLVDKNYAVESRELDARRQIKRGSLATAQIELANLQWELSQSELRAPGDGTVTSLDVSVGSVVEAGTPIVSLAEQSGFRLDVAVTSDDVGHLRKGMPVRIKLDAYDFQKYGSISGRVLFIAPDSKLPGKVGLGARPAFTVKIALKGEYVGRRQQRAPIKLGMTGVAEIVTGQESLLRLLTRSLRQSISLS